MNTDFYEGVTDNRLTEKDFAAKFGGYKACSLWGSRWIGSAILDDGTYIAFNYAKGDYVKDWQ